MGQLSKANWCWGDRRARRIECLITEGIKGLLRICAQWKTLTRRRRGSGSDLGKFGIRDRCSGLDISEDHPVDSNPYAVQWYACEDVMLKAQNVRPCDSQFHYSMRERHFKTTQGSTYRGSSAAGGQRLVTTCCQRFCKAGTRVKSHNL